MFYSTQFFFKFRRGSYEPKEQESTKPRDFLTLGELKDSPFVTRVILHNVT